MWKPLSCTFEWCCWFLQVMLVQEMSRESLQRVRKSQVSWFWLRSSQLREINAQSFASFFFVNKAHAWLRSGIKINYLQTLQSIRANLSNLMKKYDEPLNTQPDQLTRFDWELPPAIASHPEQQQELGELFLPWYRVWLHDLVPTTKWGFEFRPRRKRRIHTP